MKDMFRVWRLGPVWAGLLAVLLVASSAEGRRLRPTPPPEDIVPTLPDFWEAEVSLPQNQKLAFSFSVVQGSSGQWTGFINIPAQMVEGAALANVMVVGDTLRWSMPLPQVPESGWPRVALTLNADRTTAAGSFTQEMISSTVTAKASSIKAWRPQTPSPPFPYTSREVAFINTANPAEKITLAGTLTVPTGPGRHPAALLITGSGQQDRDETIFGHKPFWVIADHLSRRGVAVLRVDDRGIGGSTAGDLANATTETFATDAAAALDFLKTQPDLDPTRIGVIGHSEGGTIAILLASRRDDLAFAVLLAASSIPGFDILLQQNADLYRAEGASEAAIQAVVDAQRVSFTAIMEGKDIPTRKAALREVLRYQSLALDPARPPTEAELDAGVALYAPGLDNPWFKTFLRLDPRDVLPNIKSTPVLALNGTLDTQVAHTPNLAAIREGLSAAQNPDFETHALPKLNHLFQTASTGAVSEYATIRETFSPIALALISTWLTAHVLPMPQ